jgi:hypothetical protein
MNTPSPDPFDRALAAYSAREQARAIPPPAGFADRTAAVVLARPRWPWKPITAGLFTLAVAVVGVGYVVWPKPQPVPVAPEPQPVVVTPEPSSSDTPNIGDTLSGAGSAFAKLTRSTADKATPQTLLPETARAADPPPLPPDAQPGADAIVAMPAAAKSGLEPMTGSTRRAISAFLRDTGLKAN